MSIVYDIINEIIPKLNIHDGSKGIDKLKISFELITYHKNISDYLKLTKKNSKPLYEEYVNIKIKDNVFYFYDIFYGGALEIMERELSGWKYLIYLVNDIKTHMCFYMFRLVNYFVILIIYKSTIIHIQPYNPF